MTPRTQLPPRSGDLMERNPSSSAWASRRLVVLGFPPWHCWQVMPFCQWMSAARCSGPTNSRRVSLSHSSAVPWQVIHWSGAGALPTSCPTAASAVAMDAIHHASDADSLLHADDPLIAAWPRSLNVLPEASCHRSIEMRLHSSRNGSTLTQGPDSCDERLCRTSPVSDIVSFLAAFPAESVIPYALACCGTPRTHFLAAFSRSSPARTFPVRDVELLHVCEWLGYFFVFASRTMAHLTGNPYQGGRCLRVFETGCFAEACRVTLEALGISLIFRGQIIERHGVLGFFPRRELIEMTRGATLGAHIRLAFRRRGLWLGSNGIGSSRRPVLKQRRLHETPAPDGRNAEGHQT